MTIHGTVEPGFGPVADAFRANFADGAEVGAACAVYQDGRRVVDLHGGLADTASATAWTPDTVVLGFSVAKGLMALCGYIASQRGLVDFDAPVISIWPEFGANGKQDITIRQLFAHRAGLVALDADLTFADVVAWTPVIRAIEAQRPLWEPGTAYSYHALTYGWLTGEVLRRATGMMPSELIAQYLAGPSGADAWIGLPAEQQSRVATLYPVPSTVQRALWRVLPYALRATGRGVSVRAITLGGAFSFHFFDGGESDFNNPAVHRAMIPAANAIVSADGLARIYAAAVSGLAGPPLLTPDSIADATTVVSRDDAWVGGAKAFGSRSTGFMLNDVPYRPLLSPSSFGHDGAAGSLGFADADARIGFGYVTNRFGGRDDQRAARLTAALRECVG
ncbi:MAG: beta-lactamase family protein [Mycobacterium sp.]|nr:beta-lactamase family protein [Mycobacterium sp.]